MLAQRAVVYQTLVSVWRRESCEGRYLRLIDPTSRVWFHVLEEITMKHLERLYAAPRSWAERAYPKLIHSDTLAKGGHFAA